MAEGASDELRAQQRTQHQASVDSVEADIGRTRERLSLTLTALNGEVRALLDPNTPATLAPVGTRHALDKIAGGLRTAGQISALARARKSGSLGVLRAVTGLGVFLFRSGIARRLWNRKKSAHRANQGSIPVEPRAHPDPPAVR